MAAATRPNVSAEPAAAPPARPPARPLSPHLSIWKWRVHTVTSIVHRITGNALALGGVVLFLWWLVAAASGPAAYARFHAVATGWAGTIVGVGLTWVLFQHMASGIRHLVMDTGAGLEIGTSKATATATYAVSAALTLVVWAVVFAGGGH